MPRTLTIHADALRYVLPHVSTEESRPTLHGVMFEPSGLAVATNGYTLGAHRNATEPHAAPVLLRFQEPRKLTAGKVHRITITIPDELTGPDAHGWNLPVTLYGKLGESHTVGATFADMLPANTFPLWRTVYRPREGDAAPVTTLALDPALLDRFAVGVGRQTGKVALSLDGPDGAILVRYPDEPDAVGLLMPCRNVAPAFAPADVWRGIIAPPIPTPEPVEELATVGVA